MLSVVRASTPPPKTKTDASVRERKLMGAQAGPSRGGAPLIVAAAAAAGGDYDGDDDDGVGSDDQGDQWAEGEEGPEDDAGEGDADDAPFPEPEPHIMALCDLLGESAEVEAAALVQQGVAACVVALDS